jgi:L-threonylcarbamoyladenylate synthase
MDLFERSIEASLACLRRGGVILYPTDTVWGIGCDATRAEAVERIYRLKRRPDTKSMIILIADARDLLTYTAGAHPGMTDYLDSATRPTTVIYDHALGLPGNLVSADGSIAIRLVKERFCRTLIKRLGAPLVSTSANISGQPTPRIYPEISPEIITGVDYVAEYRQDDTTRVTPSRIVRVAADGTMTVIRD